MVTRIRWLSSSKTPPVRVTPRVFIGAQTTKIASPGKRGPVEGDYPMHLPVLKSTGWQVVAM